MRHAQKNGFTLVELMVVITIICILAGMLFPSVIAAKNAARMGNVKQRMADLTSGAGYYQRENQYFPGQRPEDVASLSSGTLTGSQMLGRCLLYDEITKPNQYYRITDYIPVTDEHGNVQPDPELPNVVRPRARYASYVPGDLFNPKNTEVYNYNKTDARRELGSISDRYSITSPKAILYYPSRRTTGLGQFVEGDNASYLTIAAFNGWPTGRFDSFLKDTRFGSGSTPQHDGEFLLFAADRNRMYGTPEAPTNFVGTD
jgi:prepilin-type N-terminal cleavage/methylation domain-containing protein